MKPSTATILILTSVLLFVATHRKRPTEPMPKVYSNSFVMISNRIELKANLPAADFHGTPAPE